jgi:hypothetical protein
MKYFVRGGINEVLGPNDLRIEHKILYSTLGILLCPISNESKFVTGVVIPVDGSLNAYGGV